MNVATLLTSLFGDGASSPKRGFIEVSGVLDGTIRGGDRVLIKPPGRFCGKIEARSVEIAGVVRGNVEADRLVVYTSGQLYYDDLKCRHVSVEDGGTIVKNRDGANAEVRKVPASQASGQEQDPKLKRPRFYSSF
jgi:cytoskeletal protein CcmA (bactofilin family)